jgi:predicted O-linked N-acetylglucosamine transferase (SPINDLY family)
LREVEDFTVTLLPENSFQTDPQSNRGQAPPPASGEKNPRKRVVREILALENKIWATDRAAALDFLRQGLQRYPAEPKLLARLATHATSLADWRDGPIDIARIIAADHGVMWPMMPLCLSDDPALHRAAAADYAARLPAPALPPFRHAAPAAKPKLRVGYISPDLREHPMGQCMAEVFERHDRGRFEVLGYMLRKTDGSALRARIEAGFDHVADLTDLSEAEAAARIHADGIDILVELIGYTTFSGCAILGTRPAPVQVSLLGFPGTKAAPFIDYFVGDPIVCGDGAADYFTEWLALLPETYYATDSRKVIAASSPTRAGAGLPEKAFVFCCFNYPQKITPAMFDVWMRILRQTPRSVLWLLEPWPGIVGNLRREAVARGVDPARLIFAPRLPLAEHLARLSLADLALDTLPCGAHTTAVDALWAGVPMLTCLGQSFAGRVGASLLNAVGLPELIAGDLDAYEALAVGSARDRNRLASLRQRLADNHTTHALFDCSRYTRHLETAYETMWAIHCDCGEPRSFGVLPSSLRAERSNSVVEM